VASVPTESNHPHAFNDTAPAAAATEAPPPEADATAAAETPPPVVAAEDAATAAAAATDEFATPEMVANLTAIGFPETEVCHCLHAANQAAFFELMNEPIVATTTTKTTQQLSWWEKDKFSRKCVSAICDRLKKKAVVVNVTIAPDECHISRQKSPIGNGN
jgi:hypothetical protein